MSYAKRLTAADLTGRSAISYLRFSSSPQERGSTIERQQETLDRIIAHYQLTLDQALMDKALSASKGHHRKRGRLGQLLTMVRNGEIKPGTVLIVEAIDRLFREGLLDVFPILTDMIRGGLVIVTGDLTIYDEAAINGDLSHKLVAELNAAYNYTRRLSELADGAHRRRRRQLEALADDPNAVPPILNSPPPSWIRREGRTYVIVPENAAIIQRVYDMCIAGHPVLQIAKILNAEKVPVPGFPSGVWRAPRVATILRDDHVLGFVQPCRRDGSKRIPVGRRVKLYPAVIDAATWVKVREALDARRTGLRGRLGSVGNLFTGKVFCATCGAALRVDTGGRVRLDGSRRRSYVCSRYVESRVCEDATHYDLHHFEPKILEILLTESRLAPRTVTSADEKQLAQELADLILTSKTLEESIATLAPRIGMSSALADQVERMSRDLDINRRKAEALKIRLQAAASHSKRRDEVWAFMKSLVRPAIKGDLAARERLRSLLALIDARIVGMAGMGGMTVTINGVRRDIDPPPPQRGTAADPDPHLEDRV